MNKYLLMSAAGAMATTVAGAAQASTSIHFLSVGHMSFCDGLILSASGAIYADIHEYTTCDFTGITQIYGEGIEFKGAPPPKGSGKKVKRGNVNLADGTEQLLYGDNIQLTYDISTPVAAGGTWILWATTNGTTSFVGNEGTIVAGLAKRNPGHMESTVTKLNELLKSQKK